MHQRGISVARAWPANPRFGRSNPDHYAVYVHIFGRHHWQFAGVHCHCAAFIDAHGHQLLPLQFGRVGHGLSAVWPAVRDIIVLASVSVAVRAAVLQIPVAYHGSMLVRVGADHRGLFNGALLGHLLSAAFVRDERPEAGHSLHRVHLDSEPAERHSVRNLSENLLHQIPAEGRRRAVGVQPVCDALHTGWLVRIVHRCIFRHTNGHHNRAVRVHRHRNSVQVEAERDQRAGHPSEFDECAAGELAARHHQNAGRCGVDIFHQLGTVPCAARRFYLWQELAKLRAHQQIFIHDVGFLLLFRMHN